MNTTAETIRQMYDAMLEHFGPHNWWPGDSTLEICVGAILTQNTNWANVEKAIANLKAAGAMSVTTLHKMPPQSLAELIRPAGYYNRKALRLKNFIAAVYEYSQDDIDAFMDRSIHTLRDELLSINGIGMETADSMILYAAGKPIFVVDSYTARILHRHKLIFPEADYEEIRETFESALPDDVKLFNDYHAKLVEVGKNFCRPKKPKCDQCPLRKFDYELNEFFQ